MISKMERAPSVATLLQTLHIIENAVPEVLPPSVLRTQSRALFGFSLSEINIIYAKYLKPTNSISIRDYLVTLHWLKTYPEWRSGAVFWRSIFHSDKTYREVVAKGVSAMHLALKTVQYF